MKTHWRSPQGKVKEELGRKHALKFFRRLDPSILILVGPVSLEIRSGFGLEATEELLDRMVADGLLRLATEAELKTLGSRHGYFLTEEGLEQLPRDDS